ncbi:MAG: Spx/MgsR family RNA polymerase-binding regulatory protein [Proteobacteria bacterium]|nr:Spx/MgsR family RNA polymerase-binding regulatory protein [Pseudomonadota bacterium]MCP4921697.1 Spx/MgsR family RNA polymerase-binding regulatory protein [Pseudomonadota bacterium]
MSMTLYGIPTCDSCRKARKWLAEQGHDAEWVDLRKTPPTADRVAGWVASVGSKPLKNTSGGSYRKLPQDKKAWDDARWIEAFAGDPMLLKRPILEIDGVATRVGFKGWEAL